MRSFSANNKSANALQRGSERGIHQQRLGKHLVGQERVGIKLFDIVFFLQQICHAFPGQAPPRRSSVKRNAG